MDIYDDPDAVLAATREINETLKEYVVALCDTGVDAVMLIPFRIRLYHVKGNVD